jgi:hypothetical protein
MNENSDDLTAVTTRLTAVDWPHLGQLLADHGYARIPDTLARQQCVELTARFADDAAFRKTVDMERHGFGIGAYRYFSDPLPPVVSTLRERIYAGLAPIADAMMEAMRRAPRYPTTLEAYRASCRAAGQTKTTPLLLRYEEGGYNRLHQDLYGELSFPLQATILLSEPERDFRGGEFLLVENRPRQQAIGTALALRQGEMLVFPTFERPVPGKRSTLRAQVRHGVSRITRGERFALGVIFHDAS